MSKRAAEGKYANCFQNCNIHIHAKGMHFRTCQFQFPAVLQRETMRNFLIENVGGVMLCKSHKENELNLIMQ